MSKIQEIIEKYQKTKYIGKHFYPSNPYRIHEINFKELEKELQEYVYSEVAKLEDKIDELEKDCWLGGDDVRLKDRWGVKNE